MALELEDLRAKVTVETHCALAAHAREEGRSVDGWLDRHFRLHFYGHVAMLPALDESEMPRRFAREPISAKVRGQVFDIAGGKCHYCSVALTPFNFQVDHVVPVSKGGKSEIENLVGACRSCNTKKGGKDVAAFKSASGRE